VTYDRILVRYGELSTKGKNRKAFISLLKKNIKKALESFEKLTYYSDRNRTFIDLNGEDGIEVANRLKDVFGIYSFSLVKQTETDLEAVKNTALEIAKTLKGSTFKVETKRSDKNYPLKSQEISREVGGHVLRNTEHLTVDVHNPDFTVLVEVRREAAYIYSDVILGAGGYPLGIAGKGMLLLSGGIDSPVAGYLTMKRGVKVEAIHFASPPHTSERAKEKVIDLARKLTRFQPVITMYVVPFTKLQEELYKKCDLSYNMTIMRRMMYRISEGVANKYGSDILITGESVGQVASQTLMSMKAISEVVDLPIIRPVATYDKLEIIDVAKKIDTYELSILPYEDCCTIFVPKNPATAPRIDRCRKNEEFLDWEQMVQECIDGVEVIKITPEIDSEIDDLL
jgi:thiamine biosynthesis protein ThiI